MLRMQGRARRRIPEASSPPPVVEMTAEEDMLEMIENESVFLDIGKHMVKVSDCS